MKLLGIQDKRIFYSLILVLLCFCLLSIPFKDGSSSYVKHELYRDLAVAESIDSGKLVELGPVSSLGDFHFGPAYYYLIFPFVKLLDFQPYSLAVASAFFMFLTILGTFFFVKKWFGSELMALLAAGLMSFSILTFQIVKYGSNPNFIPFFSLMFFWAIRELMDNPKSINFTLLLAISSATVTQLHAVPLVVVPLVLIAALLTSNLRKIPLLNIVVFLFTVSVLYYPYLHHEFLTGFNNTLKLFQLTQSEGLPDRGNMYVTHIFQYIGFLMTSIVSMHNFFNSLDVGGKLFTLFAAGMLLVIPIIFSINLKHRKFLVSENFNIDYQTKKLFLFWIGAPTLVYLLPWSGLNDFHYYYFFMLLPLIFITFSIGVFKLYKQGLHILSGYLFTAFFLLQVVQFVIYLRYIKTLL